jgi:co-chaperonin GroES (HSP10)
MQISRRHASFKQVQVHPAAHRHAPPWRVPRLPALYSGIFLAAMTAPVSALGSVLKVGPGSTYTSIQAAIDASVDGDVILVAPGSGGSFVVDAKSLVIAADGDSASKGVLGNKFTIQNLGPAQTVVLRNFTNAPLTSPSPPNANSRIQQCAGAVLLEDCELVDGDPTLLVEQCAGVTLSNCRITGWEYVTVLSTKSGPALVVAQSAVHLYDCTLTGADGKDNDSPLGGGAQDGQPGAIVSDASFLFAAGVIFRGGAGGATKASHFSGYVDSSTGGAGLVLENLSQTAALRECAFQPGAGGPSSDSVAVMPGNGGLRIDAANASHQDLGGRRVRLAATSPLREAQPGKLEFKSGSDYQAFVFASPTQHPLFDLSWKGTWLPASGLQYLGQVSSFKGYATLSFAVGELGPGVSSAGLYVQGAMIDVPTATARTTAPTHLLLLDAAL